MAGGRRQACGIAASGDIGEAIHLAISPSILWPTRTDRKGGAFLIMHKQFLRAIGVKAATGNAELKLNRIHYSVTSSRHRWHLSGQQNTKPDQHTGSIFKSQQL